MSQMHCEILKVMSNLTALPDDGLSADFIFDKGFVGFRGHFNGYPILPGICKVQAVIAMYTEYFSKPFYLKAILSAKYTAPVFPEQKIVMTCASSLQDDKKMQVQVMVKKGEERAAMLKMILESKG